MANVAWLSHKIGVELRFFKLISLTSCLITHITSHTVIAIDMYSASAIDLATKDGFLDFQAIGEFPCIMQKSMVDLLVLGHPAVTITVGM